MVCYCSLHDSFSCKNDALKKFTSNTPLKASKSENRQVTTFIFLISSQNAVLELIVRMTIYSVVIFSHSYLDSDCIHFKTFAFLLVY